MQEPEVDVQLWGALESDSESEEESDEEEEEEEADATGLVTPGDAWVDLLYPVWLVLWYYLVLTVINKQQNDQ